MDESPSAFVGQVPANYDRFLGPFLFEPYALDLVARLGAPPGAAVLELACGTGIVTQRLVDALDPGATLTATDLNADMLAVARAKVGDDPRVTLQIADALDLPFENGSFDVVVCQFGFMFFPDKDRGCSEAHRVLRPGGRLLISVWASLVDNPFARITHSTLAAYFPDDPPRFYEVPFSWADVDAVRATLERAGLSSVAIHDVRAVAETAEAGNLAIGLLEGNPVVADIERRAPGRLGDVEALLAARLVDELGDHPVRSPLRAFVAEAVRA